MTLLHRIQKIEEQVHLMSIGAVLLREPAKESGEEARDAFEVAIAVALAAGHQVVVHTANKEPNRRIAGVIYESDGFVAFLELAAHIPATDGRSKNKLSQIIAEAQGTTLPIVKQKPLTFTSDLRVGNPLKNGQLQASSLLISCIALLQNISKGPE